MKTHKSYDSVFFPTDTLFKVMQYPVTVTGFLHSLLLPTEHLNHLVSLALS